MPGAIQIKENNPIMSILTLKLVAIATSLEPSETGVRSVMYDQIPTCIHRYTGIPVYLFVSYRIVKFGENRSSRS